MSEQLLIPDAELPETVPEADLQKGDVLLSRATGFYANMICDLDGSEYSHAAIWSGDEVIEAVPHAVVSRELPASVNDEERQFVHVFRWKASDRAFTSELVDRAKDCVGQPYALVDVLLVAHAAVLARASGTDFHEGLSELIEQLREYEQLGERIGFTCSELVARVFYESGHPLQLPMAIEDPVRSGSLSHDLPQSDDAQLQELIELCQRIASRDQHARNDPFRSSGARSAPPFHIVSPGDIARSQSLFRVGKLIRTHEIRTFKNSDPTPTPRASAKTSDATRSATAHVSAIVERRAGVVPRALTEQQARPNGPERLLYIALATGGRPAIDAVGEYSDIEAQLRQSKQRDHLALCHPALGADALQITQALDWQQPTYVHVAGHADERGMVALGRTLDVEHLQATLGAHADRVRVVVLNACNTAELARQLSDRIGIVIGMRGEIRDSAAKVFAQAFYLTLGNGRTVGAAFDFARGQLRLHQGEDLAQLEAKLVDPDKLKIGPDEQLEAKPVDRDTPRVDPFQAAPPRAARRWWIAVLAGAALLAAIPVVLGATTRQNAAPAVSSMALIPAGVLHPGSTEAVARAAYDQCLSLEGERGLEACTRSFEASVFAREVGARDVLVPAFKLDRVEVSNEQLAHWLNAQNDRTRIETGEAALERLKLPAPAVMLDGEWLALVGTGEASLDPSIAIVHKRAGFEVVPGRERFPVRMISWLGARLYCESQGRRLPQSDEWEWAARGSAGRTFPWGERAPKDCSAVVYGRRPHQECEAKTRAPERVGTSEDVTPEGVYDLGGNLSEWTETAFGPDDFKSIRGGHFEDSIVMLASSRRFRGHRAEVYRQLGFRCAQSVDAKVAP